MLCQACNQNPATVHVTQMVKGQQKEEMHLCEACAKQEGVALKPTLSFSELLSGFIAPQFADPQQVPKKPCPNCGITYSIFSDIGRLGCPNDYEVFQRTLSALLDKVHRSSQHVGKIPTRAGQSVAQSVRLRELEEQLRTAVRTESYELAAQIRDQIAELKENPDG